MKIGKLDAKDGISEERKLWPVWARWVMSGVLAFHAVAILAGVMAGAPSSMLEHGLSDLFVPYYQAIDQGYSYRYFAPEPPPTPIVIAKLFAADGRALETVRVPERGLVPRMRYQRQLAVANALAMATEEARHNPHRPPPFWAWSFARHLGRRNAECRQVKLYLEIHIIPEIEQIRSDLASGGKTPELDAPRFYTVPELIGDFPCDPTAS